MDQNLTVEQVIINYQLLASDNQDKKIKANRFLMSLLHRQESWLISRQLITKQNDANYQILGVQILYQKVCLELQSLPVQSKMTIRDFTFNLLQDESITLTPLIDKLASISAILACTLFLDHWPNFIDDLLNFMMKSPNCLKNGLFVLQRIPQQLRTTNRIAPGYKQVIIDEFLKSQQRLSNIFSQVLKMSPQSLPQNLYKQLIKRNLMAMQSWSRSRFNFLKYPFIITQTLIHSLQDFDKLEHAIVVIVQTIKSGPSNRQNVNLSHTNPLQQMKAYSEDEVSSIKIILKYIQENCQNFTNPNMVQPEQLQAFLDIIKQSLLNFSFLMMEPVGFNLLEIIKYYTSSSDLRTSCNTFEFWIDMSEKMSKFYVNSGNKPLPDQALNKFSEIIENVFQIVNSKTIVDIDSLLDDPDLREDITVDDPNAVTFTQYRKQATLMYQYIYNFFLNTTKSPSFYFQKCFKLILKDLQKPNTQNTMVSSPSYQFHKYTQLGLFCIKSTQQSMVSQLDAQNLRKVIRFILQKVENDNIEIRARVSGEILLLISQCTTQIKKQQNLLFSCLKFSLKYILEQRLCFFASAGFKSIVQSLENGIPDANLAQNLIQFYNNNKFPRQLIVGDMLEGVISIINKLSNKQAMNTMFKKLVIKTYEKYQFIHKNIHTQNINTSNQQHTYLLSLLEIKIFLQSYNHSNQNSNNIDKQFYIQLSNNSLKVINDVIPYCLKQGQKFIPFNQLGYSATIYKEVLKICGIQQIDIQTMISVIEKTLLILNNSVIVDMCPFLCVLNETLIAFSGQKNPNCIEKYKYFNQWTAVCMPSFNNFFVKPFQRIQLVDTDVIKWFFSIQQSLMLYDPELFVRVGGQSFILQKALFALKHINQGKMQRKVVNYLLLTYQMNSQVIQQRKQNLLDAILHSIPIINSPSYPNLSKILLPLLRQINPEKHLQIIYSYLKSNPYNTIPEDIQQMLTKTIVFIVQVNNQRYLMMIFKDLRQLVLQGENSQSLMQFEMRLKGWEKQYKKKQMNQ